MAETPIKFGIIGCATIARKFCRAISLAPNAYLHAIASRTLSNACKFSTENSLSPSTKLYGSYEALLEDPDVEAVYIPLPTSLHLRWAVAAAEKKKHVLLEKPTALTVADLDRILEACDAAGVLFMDGTMWMHHPRTWRMREIISDPQRFGDLKVIQSIFTIKADPSFLKTNIRTNPNLDALGVLGDLGWYCIRSILFATNYTLPKNVIAMPNTVFNSSNVILSCGASLHWSNPAQHHQLVASFHCSFLANMTMNLTVIGAKGSLYVKDFVIPFEEDRAGFCLGLASELTEMVSGWEEEPREEWVETDRPQEARMVEEFAKLVGRIGRDGAVEKKWGVISRKTQAVVDAVRESIERGCETVEIVY